MHNKLKRVNDIKKLVSNARAIISNQIALPLGAKKMNKVLIWINQIEPLENIDFEILRDYNSKIINFALGTERLEYNSDFLKRQDKQLDKVTMEYKDKMIEKCFEIIHKFADNN